MITAILVDDEKNALEMMEWLLRTYCPEVEIAAMCTSAEEALPIIQQVKPDVVFLDIEMPRINGFDLLEHIGQPSFHVVFCTAYDQFAIRAFKYSALNYLLKPIDPDDLKATVERIQSRSQMPTREQLDLLMQGFRQLKQTPARIALSTGDGLIFVPTSDIIYCEADSNYTSVVLTSGKKILVSKVLKDIDEALSGPDFFRVHSSFLININHIKKMVRGEGGYIIMDNDATVSVSRSRRQEFMERFSRF
ncbi:LytR/AlgR family response regulator transcription factor [Flavihumibacter petaseus]|uniref:Putative two-component response regulator n=1 Tax=Flavihumibacter petaseus NBRC 106054 TaxID=1220578 RepID=A0A0E9MWE0_9BACT|nr:LytTR family DNA-binding domain-containing protein [Flavihumibacter petaseus]GAO41420.1 putative two-component response regulator [Flavihumibacter petaseus NBRC 106054]